MGSGNWVLCSFTGPNVGQLWINLQLAHTVTLEATVGQPWVQCGTHKSETYRSWTFSRRLLFVSESEQVLSLSKSEAEDLQASSFAWFEIRSIWNDCKTKKTTGNFVTASKHDDINCLIWDIPNDQALKTDFLWYSNHTNCIFHCKSYSHAKQLCTYRSLQISTAAHKWSQRLESPYSPDSSSLLDEAETHQPLQ